MSCTASCIQPSVSSRTHLAECLPAVHLVCPFATLYYTVGQITAGAAWLGHTVAGLSSVAMHTVDAQDLPAASAAVEEQQSPSLAEDEDTDDEADREVRLPLRHTLLHKPTWLSVGVPVAIDKQ